MFCGKPLGKQQVRRPSGRWETDIKMGLNRSSLLILKVNEGV
jgi:hypothetical protein